MLKICPNCIHKFYSYALKLFLLAVLALKMFLLWPIKAHAKLLATLFMISINMQEVV